LIRSRRDHGRGFVGCKAVHRGSQARPGGEAVLSGNRSLGIRENRRFSGLDQLATGSGVAAEGLSEKFLRLRLELRNAEWALHVEVDSVLPAGPVAPSRCSSSILQEATTHQSADRSRSGVFRGRLPRLYVSNPTVFWSAQTPKLV